MNKPQFQPRSGIAGFTDSEGRFICTGSSMGRCSDKPRDIVWQSDKPLRLRARKVRLNSGGYDDGGAYWGHGPPLWQLHGEDDTQRLSFFARGRDKYAAFVSTLAEIRATGIKCEIR